MIRIAILGGTGKMGQRVAHLLSTEYTSQAKLVGSIGRGGSPETLLSADVVIDFSRPEGTLELVRAASKVQGPLPAFVIGTTGWKSDEIQAIKKLASQAPVLMSSNFSTGVLALKQILESCAGMLKKLGYAPVIVETHHQHKKDAPSGTALLLAETVEASGGGTPQIHSVRAGEIIGDHEVAFYGQGEYLTLGHFAQDRSIFARGAIEAALWLSEKRGKKNDGTIRTMSDYLSEKALQ